MPVEAPSIRPPDPKNLPKPPLKGEYEGSREGGRDEREVDPCEQAQAGGGGTLMGRDKRDSRALELAIAGAAVLLSTLGFLFGSPTLTVVALVAGAVSFGILIGARAIASDS